ncbi:MAG TPA: hypothetical protein VLG11_01210 [Candidatus Saccharimonadales bacterium]|nr:hypothetical protein [Candidatus Saccharimonadales bacterium]
MTGAGSINQAVELCRTKVEATIDPHGQVTEKYDNGHIEFKKGVAALKAARAAFAAAGVEFKDGAGLMGPIQEGLDEAHAAITDCGLETSPKKISAVPGQLEGLRNNADELFNEINGSMENCNSHVTGLDFMIRTVEGEGVVRELSQEMRGNHGQTAAEIVQACAEYNL